MKHPLEQKLQSVRGRARRLLVLHGASCVVAAVLVTLAAVGLSDFLLRFEDRGIRLFATALVLGVLGWTVYRYLLGAFTARLRDVDIAMRIERRFPGLNDRLASTVQFLHEQEHTPNAGSPMLRRAVIAQTTSEIEQLDLNDVVQTRPTVRVAAAAIFVCLAAAGLAAKSPELTRIGLARLANPLGDVSWPKQNHLQLRETIDRIALGQPLELAVVDAHGARLPTEVRLRLRFTGAGDTVSEESVAMQFADGAFVYRQDSVTRPFEYRAEGGDDNSMPWTRLDVVEPPAVESMSVRLFPPAYTGWPSETADRHFRALKGTRVEIAGTSTKPLKAAALRLENGDEVPARVTDDGYGFSVPAQGGQEFVVEQTGSYALRLTDAEGFEGGLQVRYEVRSVADLPPTVVVEEPSASIHVTADATVPLRLSAKDDLIVRDLSLVYQRSDATDQGEQVLPLYIGPEQAPADSASRAGDREKGDTRVVEHRWELAALGLKAGTQITFHGVASDYLPQTGKSQPIRLTIITPAELNDRIAQRQAFILAELGRVAKMQQESRSQVNSLEIQLRDVGRLNKQDIDHLQGAELTQRQVQRTLTDAGEGIPSQIQGLLDDLKNNKVDSPDVERRMTGLLEEIGRIEREHLTTIDRELNGAIKGAAAGLPDDAKTDPPAADKPADPRIAKSVTTAGEQQDEVIASLERMLGDLSKWDNYRRFHREIGQLKTEQEDLANKTAELGRDTLTKDAKDLTPQQQADLKKLGQRQQELARRFDKVQQQMQQMGTDLDDSDPLAAGVLDDAVHQARQQQIGGKMREAGQNVEQNQVGQAAERQQQIGEGLQDLLDTLANRSEHELSRLVKKLREAEDELSGLRKQQQGLRKKLEEAGKNPDENQRRRDLERLAREQKQIQDDAERLARKLQRLQAEQASRAASKASGKMAQAGQQGEQGDGDAAEDAAAGAEKDLDDAQQALAESRKQAEADLAMEQLAKIEDGLKSMHQRQQEVVQETERLEKIRQDAGKWTRGQSLSVRDLARQQTMLGEETDGLAEKLSAAEVFALALKGAGREMAKAAQHLDARDTGALAQVAEKNALRRFEQLLESLKPDKPEKGDGEQEQGGDQGGDQGNKQAPRDGIPSLSQLKMLKLMQQEINERTSVLEQTFDRKRVLTPDEQQEYTALGEEQSQLADLVLNLSKPKTDRAEDDPAAVPDLKLDEKPKAKSKTLDDLLPKLDLEEKP